MPGNAAPAPRKKPNVVFVLADQWRAEATGYSGNSTVRTPNLDALASESVDFTHALAGCPVCSPYRASLITGRHPLTTGGFVNDNVANCQVIYDIGIALH